MWMGGVMKHLTNLAIAAGVFIFTKLYADAISFNSIELSGVNLVGPTEFTPDSSMLLKEIASA